MKVNKENNKRLVLVATANISLTFLVTIINISQISLDPISYYTLHIFTEVTYISLLVYLISILQYSNEKISIQTPFSIYLGLEFIKFILGILYTPSMGTLTSGLGLFNMCIIIYLLIAVFKIEHEKLAFPFRLFAITLVLTMVVKIILPFTIKISPHMLPSRYFGFMDILQISAILYIICSVGSLLKNADPSTANPDI
jgi:hypothetical protein